MYSAGQWSSNFASQLTICTRLGAKVLGTSVLWYSSADFVVLVGTQYSYFQKVLVLVLVLKYFLK